VSGTPHAAERRGFRVGACWLWRARQPEPRRRKKWRQRRREGRVAAGGNGACVSAVALGSRAWAAGGARVSCGQRRAPRLRGHAQIPQGQEAACTLMSKPS
jgi:hypothetical protein